MAAAALRCRLGADVGYRLSKRTIVRTIAASLAAGTLGEWLSPHTAVADGGLRTPPTVALGAFIPDAPGDPAAIDAFADRVGRTPAVVLWYQHWGGASAYFDPALLDMVIARGAMPMITWEPWVPNGGVDQPAYSLAAIARGDFDDYVDSWAVALAADGRTVYLRFGHEMNGTWYPWAAGVNGNTAADYVAAWRHVRGRFTAVGAINVRWVWSPNVAFGGSTAMTDLYPGDAYVDWLGLDGYNWGTSQSWSRWQSFAQAFGASYATITATARKPVMIAETASTELGGDKAAWISAAFAHAIPTEFPLVRAVVWFDADKETDWRIDSSEAALAAYRLVAADPAYRGTLD